MSEAEVARRDAGRMREEAEVKVAIRQIFEISQDSAVASMPKAVAMMTSPALNLGIPA